MRQYSSYADCFNQYNKIQSLIDLTGQYAPEDLKKMYDES